MRGPSASIYHPPDDKTARFDASSILEIVIPRRGTSGFCSSRRFKFQLRARVRARFVRAIRIGEKGGQGTKGRSVLIIKYLCRGCNCKLVLARRRGALANLASTFAPRFELLTRSGRGAAARAICEIVKSAKENSIILSRHN